MDPIRSFCAKLRSLAVTLDGETARLQRALTGEAGVGSELLGNHMSDFEELIISQNFEDCAGRMLHDLHSEVRTLKDDVITLLDKANLESQESIGFIKATKVLMKKNSADIMKIRELFQKYGYNRCAKNSVGEQGATSSQPEPTQEECLQKPDVKGELSDPVVPDCSVPEKVPSSPQLSDFGLERYLIPQVPPNPPQAVNNQKEEPKMLTPSSQQSLVQVLKTPEFALNMDDGECLTPKLEHFGVSEHTMCLNEDYTLGCKHVKRTNYASEEALETEPVPSDSATPGLVDQHPEKNDAEYTSPLAPTFCTPGLKIPSIKNNEDSSSTDCPWSQTSSSSGDLHVQACAPSSVVSSRRRSEGQAAPSSPGVSAHEHLLRTPTPPRVTAIPDDVLQILSKYNPNLATTPVAVKAMPPSKAFLTRCEGQNI